MLATKLIPKTCADELSCVLDSSVSKSASLILNRKECIILFDYIILVHLKLFRAVVMLY